jgi:hypothetical protein
MNPEDSFTDPALDEAVTEIRDRGVDPALIEAAAARVWAKLNEAADGAPSLHIRGCADFQSLIPEFRAGRLPPARALLLEDHLHQCVACRRVYEGKVVAMPGPAATPAPVRSRHIVRWAATAAAAVAAAVAIYVYANTSAHTGRAMVQALNGRLYLATAAGFQPLAAAQDLPEGAEIRTAQDSDAVLRLRDGSLVELRERSGFSTTEAGNDLTIRLARGSVIVEAAKRRTGRLYVDTADCRVAVTGTIFGVSAGAKGSRVSVIEGQVRVAQGATDRLLKPGEQAVSSDGLEPEPVREDIAWSRNRDRYYALPGLRAALERVHLPELRYSSKLAARLPANTALYASIPNLADYLGRVQSVFNEKTAENPALGEWWAQHGTRVRAVLDRLRAASGYLGDEIVLAAVPGGHGPALVAEVTRDGFAQFLAAQGLQMAVESRNGMVVFGPDREAVAQFAPAMDAAEGGFRGTPFYARIAQAYSEGAGLLLCADLSRMAAHGASAGARYLVAEQKEVNHRMETRATLAFDGARRGPANWLDAPGPMGSLDYISPEASALGAFVVRHPTALIDQLAGFVEKTPAEMGAAPGQQTAPEVQKDLDASLGGEFALAVDGPLVPVPSWKLIVEVYDPARVESAIERLVANYNQHPAPLAKSLAVSREAANPGATFYSIAGSPKNPLTEAHYTFSGGYMIAAPTRALVERALQVKESGTSILRSSKFMSLAPRDHYANFSAVVYHNLGQSLAPFAALIGQGTMEGLGNLKPMLIAVYSQPDAITAASNGDVLGMSLGKLIAGSPGDWAAGLLPFGQFAGTRERKPAYGEK